MGVALSCLKVATLLFATLLPWLKLADIVVTQALNVGRVKLEQTALNCDRANIELEIFQKR